MCNLHPADINGRPPLEHATVWACDADKCCSLNGIYPLHACFSIMRLALSCHPAPTRPWVSLVDGHYYIIARWALVLCPLVSLHIVIAD